MSLLLLTTTGTVTWADSTNQTPISVGGNDTINGYEGTGGLLLPNSYTGPAKTRTQVARCIGCTWRYTVYCDMSNTEMCAHAVVTCPTGKIRYRVWFGQSKQTLAVVGSVCWGSSKPATRRDVEQQVRQSALRLVPELRPGVSPSHQTLTSIPIIVWSGQQRVFRPKSMSLSGHKVHINAEALWLWQWGDGVSNWVAQPGAAYPSRLVTHRYSRPGRYSIRLTTVWRARYTVSGLGSFAVSGEVVRQQKTLKIVVKSSRSVLTAQGRKV